MSIGLEAKYPGRTLVDANNPRGTFLNSSIPGALDGTPGEAAWARDIWGFLERITELDGFTPSGVPDNALISQRYDALVRLARNNWPIWDSVNTYPAGVIVVGSDDNPYYSLQAANLNNDPISSPAWWSNFSFEALQTAARNVWVLWDMAETYIKGALVVASDEKTYQSLQNGNINKDPTSEPTWWKLFDSSILFSASQSAEGLAYLPKQIIATPGAVDQINFSGGTFILDDGSARRVVPPYVKDISLNWVSGTGGGLDTGIVAINTWYYLYAIHNPSTGLSDYIFTATLGSPTLPSGYTEKSYQGAFRYLTTDFKPFDQDGKRFIWKDQVLEVNTPIFTGAREFLTTTTPPGLKTEGIYSVLFVDNGLVFILILSVSETDRAPVLIDHTIMANGTATINAANNMELQRVTDLSSQITYRSDTAGAPPAFLIWTRGYIDNNIKF